MNLREVLMEEKLTDGIEDATEASILLNLARLNKGKVVIYGAGQMGACIARWLLFHGMTPAHFIDSDVSKKGTRVENIEVKHISDIGTEVKRNVYVTVGFRPYETSHTEKEKIDVLLSEHGYLRENIFYMASLNTSMLCRRSYYIDHIEEMEWLHDRLEDEESKQTLVELVRSITQNDSYLLREHRYDDKYWGCDFDGNDAIYTHLKDECFVNCGSYTGDTIFKFLGKGYEFSKIYAIEGDAKMYDRLCGNINRLDERYREKILLKNMYIGMDDEKNKFDNLFKDTRVTLINADIEGAEMGVLRGARQIIRSQRPGIAFCAYHKQEDPYEIVKLIDEVGEDWHFFLRKYPAKATRLPIEFVIYAVPRERLLRRIGN
ncbi:MAG: FkbM family methyltransferase [Ruminococcus flavefaciens]|nr:FkbM family methyltransferase [Ruminococcus flavefaciens]